MLQILNILISLVLAREPYRIAVIDSGFDFTKETNFSLCRGTHANFANMTTAQLDQSEKSQFKRTQKSVFDLFSRASNLNVGLKKPPKDTAISKHGTNVAHIIGDYLKDLPKDSYCISIINYYQDIDLNLGDNQNFLITEVAAFIYASGYADIINFSGNGPEKDFYENAVIKQILNKKKTKIVVAAGNSGLDISKKSEHKTYPASVDSRLIVVGSMNNKGNISTFSNRGDIVYTLEVGESVTAGGVTLSGTSQAAPKTTAKIARAAILERLKNERSAKKITNGKEKREAHSR